MIGLRNTLKPSTILVKEISLTLNQRITKKETCIDNISVSTTRNIIAFTVMADNLYTPHQPKLAVEIIKILQPLVTISAGYNRNMSSNLKLKLEENLTAQASLSSLKFFKNAFDLLKSALERTIKTPNTAEMTL